MAEHWSYCPECGMVWQDGRAICEINGAGAETIPIDPMVGAEMVHTGNAYAWAIRTLNQVRLYGQKMLRDRDETVRRCGGDLMQLLLDAERGQ